MDFSLDGGLVWFKTVTRYVYSCWFWRKKDPRGMLITGVDVHGNALNFLEEAFPFWLFFAWMLSSSQNQHRDNNVYLKAVWINYAKNTVLNLNNFRNCDLFCLIRKRRHLFCRWNSNRHSYDLRKMSVVNYIFSLLHCP